MDKQIEQKMCEEATGCNQQGKLVYYNEEGEKITLKQASELLQTNQLIEIPAAGSGNYREVFTSLGFEEVEVIDWTSSAGDWTFGVKNENGWYMAVQENRYPYHGFKYMISDIIGELETFEELCKEIEYI